MPAQLVIIEGQSESESRGQPISLEHRVIFEIGRSDDADLTLNDPDIVPVHLKIYKEKKEFHIFDLSGRGFLVNGRRRLKHHLIHEDIIAIGSHAIRFEQYITNESSPELDYVKTVPDVDREELAFMSQAGAPAEESAGPKAELKAIKGNDTGKTFDILNRPMSVMGRGIATDITVWDIRCSRVHARIDSAEATYTVSDMNSSNGTYVNGRKIESPVPLKSGDTIKIGSTTLQFTQSV